MTAQKRTASEKSMAERKTQQGKSYSDEEKAAALEAVNLCGGNVAEAARKLGIAESTIRQWTSGHCVDEQIYADFAAKKAGRATSKLRAMIDRLADSLADENAIEKASLQQRATTLGIIVDKVQLLSGAPTQITQHLDAERVAALRAEAEAALQDALLVCAGDKAAALAMLATHAPTLSKYIN